MRWAARKDMSVITFEVLVNGRRKCLAGIDSSGVLSSILTWTNAHPPGQKGDGEVCLQVGGLVTPASGDQTHVQWVHENVEIGDEITVRITRTEAVDPPCHSEKSSSETIEKQERVAYRALKRKFERKTKRQQERPAASPRKRRRPN